MTGIDEASSQFSPTQSSNLCGTHRLTRLLFQLAFSFGFFFGVEGGMGCSQARYRHAIRRTAHVVQSNLITESDRLRVAAVFAADADLQIGFDVAAPQRQTQSED